MQSIDFFFDPVSPWAWMASRWILEVASLRELQVNWKFFSLKVINRDRNYELDFPPGYLDTHALGFKLLRVAAAVRKDHGNDAVERLYGTFGRIIHHEDRRFDLAKSGALISVMSEVGLPMQLADAMSDEIFDPVIESETALALSRAGTQTGTPVLSFDPPDGPSIFGPVISEISRGQDALDLWNATEYLARNPAFSELKRSPRPPRIL